MPDILDRLKEQQRLQENQDLSQAEHDSYWANSFASTPPIEAQRARLNLADTVSRVENNRLALAAQNDRKALELMENHARFKEWQDQAPLREQLLKNHVASAGAAQRFAAEKDTRAMEHITGFFNELPAGPQPGSKEYPAFVSGLVAKYPAILATKAGMQAIEDTLKEHKRVEEYAPMEGYDTRFDIVDGRVTVHRVPKHTTPQGSAPYGTETIKEGDVKITRPLPAPGTPADLARQAEAQKRALEEQHATLESQLRKKEGKMLQGASVEEIKRINDVKKQLGYDLLDSNGKVVPNSASPPQIASSPVPNPAIAPPGEAPEITDKTQYDSLPSGAEFVWNGKRGKKP